MSPTIRMRSTMNTLCSARSGLALVHVPVPQWRAQRSCWAMMKVNWAWSHVVPLPLSPPAIHSIICAWGCSFLGREDVCSPHTEMSPSISKQSCSMSHECSFGVNGSTVPAQTGQLGRSSMRSFLLCQRTTAGTVCRIGQKIVTGGKSAELVTQWEHLMSTPVSSGRSLILHWAKENIFPSTCWWLKAVLGHVWSLGILWLRPVKLCQLTATKADILRSSLLLCFCTPSFYGLSTSGSIILAVGVT